MSEVDGAHNVGKAAPSSDIEAQGNLTLISQPLVRKRILAICYQKMYFSGHSKDSILAVRMVILHVLIIIHRIDISS